MRRLLLLLPLVLALGCPRLPSAPPTPAPVPTPAPKPPPTAPAPAPKASPTTEAKPDLPKTADAEAWATYKGAWFSIEYPEGFMVVPRQDSQTKADGYDGVSFVSRDGRVEFYVFSPQWKSPCGWADVQRGETEEDRTVEEKGDVRVEQVTVRGPHGDYFRSWADVTNAAQNARHVFGFRYRNAAAYADFKPLYLRFKASLQQFAD
jgi:hypothetical protein